MSLHQLANHMSAQGRGPDSTLVHMSPREVSGLQSLAMAHGGTLTINPETGLPEAGFLDSLLPTLLGGAATFFSGGTITPFMAALGVGGLTALTSKDLGKGLMAGLGAYGGSGIAGGLMNFGEAAIGAEAASGALPAGVDKFGADAIAFEPQQLAAEKAARAGASNFDRLSRGVTEGFKNPMGAFSAIGGGSKLQGAAMIGAPLLSALSSQDQTSVPTPEQIKFDPSYANINIRRDQLPYQPDTGSSAQRGYFGPTYVNRNAAEGGFVSDDGIEHFAAGGIPLDPNYDYSGYGRKKTDVVRPVTRMPDMPKPDFLAADGKTYRYDPIKRSWYVIKEADAKTNAGVETLMGGAGMGGNDGGQYKAPSPFTPITDNGFFASILGRTTQNSAPIVTRDMYTPSALAEREARLGRYSGLSGLQARQAETDAEAALNAESQALEKQTHIKLTTQYENALQEAANKAEQAQRDAVTSASSPTATGGKANSPSGLASLAAAPAAPALSQDMFTYLDAPMAAKIAAENAAIDAAAKEKADKAADITAAIARATEREAAQAQIDEKAQADRETANMARQVEAQAQAQQAQAAQAQEAAQATAMANAAASLAAAEAPSFTPDTAPSAPAPDYGPSGSSDSGGFTSGADASGYGGGDLGGFLAKGGYIGRYAQGGLGSLGGYSDGGRLLRGPGDGVSDSIPATVGGRQPARLADGEFVVPARIVSELGNGSTEAGARALYKMMDRIQANRRKTTGKNSVAVNSKSHKYLPA